MAKGNKKKAKKRAQKAVGGAAPTTTTTTGGGGATGTTTTIPKPLNDSNKMTPKSGPVPPSPSKPIRLPSPEQAASLEKLQSFPTPTKSNGKDVEKTPEYVWKAPYEPGSAWADQVDSDMFKRGEKKSGTNTIPGAAASPSPGGKRLSMTPQSVAMENLTEASLGKMERVIAEATSPARIPDAKKAPSPPAAATRQPSPLSRQSQPQYAQQQQQQQYQSQPKVPTPQRKAQIERKSFIERTFTPAKEKLDKNPLIAEIVREREEAAKKQDKTSGNKSGGEKSFLENTLANLKENKIAAIGIGAGAVAFLVKTMGKGQQKSRA
ncbi:unnamed protein product [Bathycoccus prasinos]